MHIRRIYWLLALIWLLPASALAYQKQDVQDISGAALFEAIKCQKPAEAIALVRAGADVHYRSEYGESRTPLSLAVSLGYAKLVHLLLERGAETNEYSLMLDVAENGNTNLARDLLAHGARVNPTEDVPLRLRFTALYSAIFARKENPALVRLLLDHGANVNDISKDDDMVVGSQTPLIAAARLGRMATVRLLLQRGADAKYVSPKGMSAMLAALSWRHLAVVKLLHEQGIGLNVRDENGETGLIMAASDPELLRYLLQNGGEVNATDADGVIALIRAVDVTSSLSLLLNHGADIHARDHQGRTTLMYLLWGSSYRSMLWGRRKALVNLRLLLDHGARLTDRDESGKTPLLFLIHEITMSGGSIITDIGPRAKEAELEAYYRPIVQLLIARGADVNAQDNAGETSLLKAARYGKTWLAALLLKAGARSDITDKKGETPLSLAKAKGYWDIMALLKPSKTKNRSLTMRGKRAAGAGRKRV